MRNVAVADQAIAVMSTQHGAHCIANMTLVIVPEVAVSLTRQCVCHGG